MKVVQGHDKGSMRARQQRRLEVSVWSEDSRAEQCNDDNEAKKRRWWEALTSLIDIELLSLHSPSHCPIRPDTTAVSPLRRAATRSIPTLTSS
ncbi:hypothetical protein GUJ93_ZPchr0005g14509 [Zizania palustris]|uniref:Uncharacterized protein n=1 Tax=Zizania palustris TaxID=103762 RepID=A0A8J5W0U0_ZIZPA|nr:hypothetical protein GUJ93_ZPchr0005g14509 [Zizania palustris]